MALAILTGIRDRALVSLSLRHIDMGKTPPLVRQEPDRVETKFAKNISTYFFPVGDGFRQIVAQWVEELQTRLCSVRTIRCFRGRKWRRTATGRFASRASNLPIGRMRRRCAQSTRKPLRGPVWPYFPRILSATRSATRCRRCAGRRNKSAPGARTLAMKTSRRPHLLRQDRSAPSGRGHWDFPRWGARRRRTAGKDSRNSRLSGS